jgi:hypothetical protein
VLPFRNCRVWGAILETVRGDCRNGGVEEEDIEEFGRRPEAEVGLCTGRKVCWTRASELTGR